MPLTIFAIIATFSSVLEVLSFNDQTKISNLKVLHSVVNANRYGMWRIGLAKFLLKNDFLMRFWQPS